MKNAKKKTEEITDDIFEGLEDASNQFGYEQDNNEKTVFERNCQNLDWLKENDPTNFRRFLEGCDDEHSVDLFQTCSVQIENKYPEIVQGVDPLIRLYAKWEDFPVAKKTIKEALKKEAKSCGITLKTYIEIKMHKTDICMLNMFIKRIRKAHRILNPSSEFGDDTEKRFVKVDDIVRVIPARNLFYADVIFDNVEAKKKYIIDNSDLFVGDVEEEL